MSVAQYFNSYRSILDPNENFLESKMISERSSTNPISLTLFGGGNCNRSRDPMEYSMSMTTTSTYTLTTLLLPLNIKNSPLVQIAYLMKVMIVLLQQ
jgi:hypothetical protein